MFKGAEKRLEHVFKLPCKRETVEKLVAQQAELSCIAVDIFRNSSVEKETKVLTFSKD